VTLAASAFAQPSSIRQLGGYFMLSGGLSRPDNDRMEIVARDTYDINTFEIRTNYPLGNRPIFDIAGGVVLGARFTAGLAYARQTSRRPATMTVMLDEPAYLPLLTDSMESESLERADSSFHVQFGYLFERGRLRVMGFGGPSRINVDGEIVSDFEANLEGDSPATARLVLEECYYDDVSRSGWGFNVGGDASFFFSRYVGVGVTARYSRADVMLPNYLQMMFTERDVDQRVTVGRLHAVAGARFRF
jgi:hypothetical protein